MADVKKLDLMYAVNLLSQFMDKRNKIHLGAAKKMLRHIKGTCNFKLCTEEMKKSS